MDELHPVSQTSSQGYGKVKKEEWWLTYMVNEEGETPEDEM